MLKMTWKDISYKVRENLGISFKYRKAILKKYLYT